MQLPIDPKEPQWGMVMSDYDVLTRAHLNALFAACPAGVGYTVIADSSASHALLPYPVANGADSKVRHQTPQTQFRPFKLVFSPCRANFWCRNRRDVVCSMVGQSR